MFQIKIANKIIHRKLFSDAYIDACTLAHEYQVYAIIISSTKDIGLGYYKTMIVNPRLNN